MSKFDSIDNMLVNLYKTFSAHFWGKCLSYLYENLCDLSLIPLFSHYCDIRLHINCQHINDMLFDMICCL